MVWRGSASNRDKLFACLVYLMPLIEVLPLGFWLYNLIPPLFLLVIPLRPLSAIYHLQIGGIAVVQWGLFIGLYVGVVRSYKFVRFFRYHVMQAILLGIFAALCTASLQFFGLSSAIFPSSASGGTLTASLLLNIAYTLIFIFVAASSIYSMVQCLRGLYAEIPIISNAAYNQVQ
jgi:hypothetical protein